MEFVFTAALTAIHLSRLAEDWIIYSTQEFGGSHFLFAFHLDFSQVDDPVLANDFEP